MREMNDMNADGRVEAERSWAAMHEAENERDSILIASRCVTSMFLGRQRLVALLSF